jgi:hypothetical protein
VNEIMTTAGTDHRPAARAAKSPDRSRRRFRATDTINRRLAAVLAVPTAAVLALLGIGIATQVSTYRASDRVVRAVRWELAVQDLVHEMQRERGLTNGLLGGDTAYRPQVMAERTLVTAARARLDQALGTGTGSVAGAAADGAEPIRRALAPLDALGSVRDQVDQLTADRAATSSFFTDRITALNRLDLGVASADDDQLRRGAAALQALGEAKEAAARERGFLNGVFAASRFRGEDYIQFTGFRAARLAWLDAFERTATASQRQSVQAATGSDAASDALALEQEALAGADGRRLVVSPPVWWKAMTHVIDDLRGSQVSVGADLTGRASTLAHDAVVRLWTLAGVALACILGGLVVVIGASRSITRPLAGLVAEADAAASIRLPDVVRQLQVGDGAVRPLEPVRVPPRSSVEIRSVAEAVDRVQTAAHDLAGQQALLRRNTTESLASLGRRSQNLLRRQLGFISGLEREEADPEALANLFELDHLATRMRRNAESLLVLVGESGPRVRSGPLPIADVIRAATAEVEEYVRITLRRLDEGTVIGSLVSEVAHLLAELLENGLSFSPPDAEVEIHGRWIEAGYLIAVIDHGIGMTADDLAQANARLSGTENFLVAPTRFLGHYVVAALARRIGATVTLTPSPVTGVTARVVLSAGSVVTRPGFVHEAGRPASVPVPVAVADRAVEAGVSAAQLTDGEAGRVIDLTRVERDPAPDGLSDDTAPVTRIIVPERTRNGLVKRKPRSATPSGATRPDRLRSAAPSQAAVTPIDRGEPSVSAPVDPADPVDPAERTPDAVRSMISALRAGIRRGETRDPAAERPTPTPGPANEAGE